MAEILSPRPAATVITVRDSANGYEILMLRRNLNSDFVGGAYVFPGGGVDESDAGPVGQRLAFGLSDAEASLRPKARRCPTGPASDSSTPPPGQTYAPPPKP